MNDAKYIGLDVHQATISAVVLDSAGHLVMESILETKAATILQFRIEPWLALHNRAACLRQEPNGVVTKTL
jgi:hypothetical protein